MEMIVTDTPSICAFHGSVSKRYPNDTKFEKDPKRMPMLSRDHSKRLHTYTRLNPWRSRGAAPAGAGPRRLRRQRAQLFRAPTPARRRCGSRAGCAGKVSRADCASSCAGTCAGTRAGCCE